MRVGVIGCGDVANVHIAILKNMPSIQLVAVCDIDAEKQNLLKDATFYKKYEDMLEHEHLDCVHICLPHYLHVPISTYCLQHGVHVLLEKPLGLNHQEAQKLVELEKISAHKICLCLQNRMNASFLLMQKLIQEQTYGKVCGIKGIVAWARPSTYYENKPWRGKFAYAGGGVMINQSIHTLDLIQILGGEIQAIRGSVSKLCGYDIEVEDTASAAIDFKNGIRAWYVATNANSHNDNVELQVHCDRAVLTIRENSLFVKEGDEIEKCLVEDAVLAGPKSYYGAGHKIVFEHFYDALQKQSEDYIHIDQGIISMKMIDAIQLSSNLNKTIRMEELDFENL